METKTKAHSKVESDYSSGFALLMSLMVVSVVLAIGVSILDLSQKQVRLSTNVKESEKAFHAANAGMECARFWRRQASTAVENGESFDPTCFGVSAGTVNAGVATVDNANDAEAYFYQYSITWGSGADSRCTKIRTLTASTTVEGDGAVVQNVSTLFPGYPGGNTYACENGGRCTVIAVNGYNKPCANINTYGTVEREVLLEL